jgi:SPOR domain
MSGSALMAPQVNLDEFERRLRAAGSPVGPQEDPLDELARLVGLDARETKPAQKTFAFAPKAEAPRLPPVHLLRVDEQSNRTAAIAHLPHAGFGGATEAAPLRGTLEDDADIHDRDEHDDTAHAGAPPPAAVAQAPARRRSRGVTVSMGVLVAVGAAGLVGAWVVKGAPGMPKIPPMIMAMGGPTKVQPPSQETISSPSDSASVLLKDQTGKTVPVKLVSSEEQPVDLQQQAKAQAIATPAPAIVVASVSSAAADPAPVPAVSTQSPPVASAAAAAALPSPVTPPTPVPVQQATRSINLSNIGTPPAPPAAALPPAAAAPFPEPKRVKTVSVRPDGSVISSGAETTADAGAAATAPAATGNPVVSDALPDATPQPAHPPVPRARPSFDADARNAAQAATPKLDLPTKLAPKSTTRVPTARTDTTVASGAAQSPPQSPEAAGQPTQPAPSIFQAVAKAVTGQPQQVASADPVTTETTGPAAATGSGSYAVQLAAPGTEREAQNASTHLQSKYASELGGAQPTIREAEVNGRSIWRVRISDMSKAAAVSLCMKLKASGGDGACFIAKN